MKKEIVFTSILLFCAIGLFSQTNSRIIKDLVLQIDTNQFSLSQNKIIQNGESRLGFYFQKEDAVCELRIFPENKDKFKGLKLLGAADYVTLDSMVFVNNEYYRQRIRFVNLFRSQFLNFTFSAGIEGSEKSFLEEIKLLPYTKTELAFGPVSEDLYLGEEKVVELVTNNVKNIRLNNEWSKGQDINYRVLEENGKLMVHLLPVSAENKEVKIRLQTFVPFVTPEKQITYDLPEVSQLFRIKTSRLVFLSFDKQEITYDETTRLAGLEVSLDNGKFLSMGKTYRLENQEQPGGALIAELFTKSSLTNDKVLCIIRPFNLHRKSEGYLYIKDGDVARFVTNCDITPKTNINSVMVMHEGGDWTPNLSVNPGETINVKIEGEGLHKAKFHWDDVIDVTSDTILKSENLCFFRLKVPLDITMKRVSLYNGVTPTTTSLNVKEFQVPRKMDYVNLNFGNGNRILSSLPSTTIQRRTIKDLTVSFDNNHIDSGDKLFGKQYMDIDIKILGTKNEILELKTIKNVLVCPGESSPRSIYYKDKASISNPISLNSTLGTKTYNLEDFSKIQMTFKNQEDKYQEPGYEKQVEIVLQRPVVFDIDVSFPTGLMIQNLGGGGSDTTTFTDNLGGISLAIIPQFRFPDPERVGKTKPYRIGVGFLAINAFNFSSGASRDLAAVVLASLYPVKQGKIFNLPIHIGFGYKFQGKTAFIMLSPGIGITF